MKRVWPSIALLVVLFMIACTPQSEDKEARKGNLTAISDSWVEIQTEKGIEQVQFNGICDEEGHEIKVQELENGMYVSVENRKKRLQ